MAATETKRGGRYILPTLRLMSSDLVIDEIDDFTGSDLIAIGRLIHLAGMLGRKVMISSATIPPFLAEGYFKAYRDGWQLYCKTRDASQTIGCVWMDEFATHVTSNNSAETPTAVGQYRQQHKAFIDKRIIELKKQLAKRKADISDCDTIIEKYKNKSHQSVEVQESKRSAYFKRMAESVMDKHKHQHLKDIDTGLNVSFGVIRVANIQPCVNLTQYLFTYSWPNNIEVRIMAYHSQQVLLMRSEQEKHLDEVLKRKDKKEKTEHTLYHPIVRTHLQNIKQNNPTAKHVIFILVATPVEEVGRDHDFDWAVIEPSSYRSFIQLAGRVKRHREGETTEPNIALMQYNLKGLIHHDKPETPVFIRPGFEDVCPLVSHDLSALVDTEEIAKTLDAIPRIRQPQGLSAESIRTMQSAQSLVELEHAATWYWLANYRTEGKGAQVAPDTLQGWLNHHWFLSALPQELTPFRKSEPRLKVFLTFDEYQQTSVFCEKDEQGEIIDRETSLNIQRFELSEAAKKRLWLVRDFDKCCSELANKHQDTQRRISLRYGELNFPWQATKHYGYNDQLGLVKV